jgi:hypothetical protein
MSDEMTDVAGCVGLEYVSARVKSHIRIVASVEPVAIMLSSICRHLTEARISAIAFPDETIVSF